jgi:hypothetical protein
VQLGRTYKLLAPSNIQYNAERTEWFIEDQAFSPSHDRSSLLAGKGDWGGGRAESFDSEKAWSSENHFTLSATLKSLKAVSLMLTKEGKNKSLDA